MSVSFQRFKYSFFEDPTSAMDALDIPSLTALEGDERTQAETMLIEFLPDSRAVIGLGVLRSKRAEMALCRLFDAERAKQLLAQRDGQMHPGRRRDWYPSAMLYLTHALWRINPDPRWPQAAIELLSSETDAVFREEAVEALHGVDEPEVVAALTKALDDAEPLVRYAAARELLTLYGLPAKLPDPQDMTIRLMSEDAVERESGKRDIRAAIGGRAMVRQ